MKRYSFFVNGELKRSGTKEEIYEISNKENCLCKADFDEVDKNGRFSYYCAGRCVLTHEETVENLSNERNKDIKYI